jgi:hypothetical protein
MQHQIYYCQGILNLKSRVSMLSFLREVNPFPDGGPELDPILQDWIQSHLQSGVSDLELIMAFWG